MARSGGRRGKSTIIAFCLLLLLPTALASYERWGLAWPGGTSAWVLGVSANSTTGSGLWAVGQFSGTSSTIGEWV